jgi:hypothetical protein
MRILEGVGTVIQLGGLLARLCKLVCLTVRYGGEGLLIWQTEHETRTFPAMRFLHNRCLESIGSPHETSLTFDPGR